MATTFYGQEDMSSIEDNSLSLEKGKAERKKSKRGEVFEEHVKVWRKRRKKKTANIKERKRSNAHFKL
jgi:hypothetical protein